MLLYLNQMKNQYNVSGYSKSELSNLGLQQQLNNISNQQQQQQQLEDQQQQQQNMMQAVSMAQVYQNINNEILGVEFVLSHPFYFRFVA